MKIKYSLISFTILISSAFTYKAAAQEDHTYSQSKKFFNIDLPEEFSIHSVYNNKKTLDYADYKISYMDTLNYITTSSYNLGITFCATPKECYEEQLLEWEKIINITYKTQKNNWFVISGIEKISGNIFYLKGFYGEKYYSKLTMIYPQADKFKFNEYVADISKSFKGK